jgi:hypothetical protein
MRIRVTLQRTPGGQPQVEEFPNVIAAAYWFIADACLDPSPHTIAIWERIRDRQA